MAFTSVSFVFIFLPITIILYYLLPKIAYKNILLVILSLLFYAWGDKNFFYLFIISIFVNYCFGLLFDKYKNKFINKIFVFLMIVWNFGILYYFKYLIFTVNSINSIADLTLTVPNIITPLGISFITFRAVSYCLDVFFQACSASRNPINVALYITFFPQVIMGPITKYYEFEPQINKREFSLDNFTEGVERFIIGLAKKILIADNIAPMVNTIFTMEASERTVVLAWIGALGYLIQLYFDFSGYSDMAIGIGKMLGFKTPENFNYPYMSRSAVEYWSRWHITLGTWVKDYIYVPAYRAMSNKQNIFTHQKFSVAVSDSIALFLVWLFIGFWHGAGYAFLLHGMYWFFFIFLERRYDAYKKAKRKKLKIKRQALTRNEKILAHIYFIIILFFSQTLFRIADVSAWIDYSKNMTGLTGGGLLNDYAVINLIDNLVLIIAGIFFSFPIGKYIADKFKEKNQTAFIFSKYTVLLILFCFSILWVISGTNNSFIYFQF